MGFVYLYHFERPLHHAQHYVGYTEDLKKRDSRHRAGDGSRLLRAVRDAGIKYWMVRVWEGTRALERKLKKLKNSPRLCPVCMKAISPAALESFALTSGARNDTLELSRPRS